MYCAAAEPLSLSLTSFSSSLLLTFSHEQKLDANQAVHLAGSSGLPKDASLDIWAVLHSQMGCAWPAGRRFGDMTFDP